MTRVHAKRWATCLLTIPALLIPAAARAGEHPFPLAAAVPDDAFLLVAAKHNPEREFLDKAWGDVFKALSESGVLEEAWGLISAEMTPEQKAEADAACARVHELLAGVNWSSLCGKGMVFAMRMKSPDPMGGMPEMLVLARGESESAAKTNFDGLKAILAEVKKRAGDEVELTDSDMQGASVTTIRPTGAPPMLSASLARRGDIILFAVRDGLLNDALGMLGGKSKCAPMIESKRFQSAFDGLPAAEDAITYFDAKRMFGAMRDNLDAIEKMGGERRQQKAQRREKPKRPDVGAPAGEAAEADDSADLPADDAQGPKAWMATVRALFDEVSVVDHMAATVRTDGMRVFTDTRTVLTPQAKNCGLYKVMVSGRRIEPFDKFIPAEAVSFSSSAGGDWGGFYQWLRTFVGAKVPDGANALGMADGFLEHVGFNPQRDLFAWIEGPITTISLPSGSPMGGDDSVLMIKVSDDKLAAKKVQGAFDHIDQVINQRMGGAMGGGGQGGGEGGEAPVIVSTPVKIAGKSGFYQIRLQHPMLMMIAMQFQPVWGVSDGYLFFSTSKRAVELCLQTAAGEHDNVRKAARFRDEALAPESKSQGELTGISFTDQSQTAEQMQQVLASMGMLGMFAQMGAAGGGGAEAAQMQKVFSAIGGIAAKLTPVAAKLNFFQSTASCTTFDGKAFHQRDVQNYRKPPAPAKSDSAGKGDADDWGDDWGDEKNGKAEKK